MKMKPLYNLFMILALLIVLGLSPSQPALAQTMQDETPPPPELPELMVLNETLGYKPVVIYADPNVSDFQQGPPPEYQMMMEERSSSLMASPFVIDYVPKGGYSLFYDQTACIDFPAKAKEAFNFAVSIWASMLPIPSSTPIHIQACWLPINEQGVLGFGGYPSSHANFPNAPIANTWYPSSLANSLAGKDLNGSYPEIVIAYNSNFASSFYYGSSTTPSDKYNLASIVLHEITHGLGFSGSMYVDGPLGYWGYNNWPEAYDRYAVDDQGRQLINTSVYPNPSSFLAYALTRNAVYFAGPKAKLANNGQPAKLFTPFTWAWGSSYAHLDDIYNDTPNSLMTWSLSLGETNYDPGPITKGILADVGWKIEKPVETYFATEIVSEDIALSSPVGSFKTLDFTPGDTHTYKLVSGTGSTYNYMFSIKGNTLYTAKPLDYDKTQGKLSIRVRTTDKAGLYLDKVFTVTTKNVNEVATKVFLLPNLVRPGMLKGSQITRLGCDDLDYGDTLTYSFVEGENDNALFTISGDKLITNFDMPDESGVNTTYTIQVTVKDALGFGPAAPSKITLTIRPQVYLPYIGKK